MNLIEIISKMTGLSLHHCDEAIIGGKVWRGSVD